MTACRRVMLRRSAFSCARVPPPPGQACAFRSREARPRPCFVRRLMSRASQLGQTGRADMAVARPMLERDAPTPRHTNGLRHEALGKPVTASFDVARRRPGYKSPSMCVHATNELFKPARLVSRQFYASPVPSPVGPVAPSFAQGSLDPCAF